MEINKTYDYSKFKFLSYNRKVGSNKNLSKSIEMANLTQVCPIIVTPNKHCKDTTIILILQMPDLCKNCAR